VVELLPGRDGVELKEWLARHPEVEVLSRDRASAFADAASDATPKAQQVADRFHLFANVREALQRFLERHATLIAEVFAPISEPAKTCPQATAVTEVPPTCSPAASAEDVPPETQQVPESSPQREPTARQRRRLERYVEVRRRHQVGHSARRIAREMGLGKNTVLGYLQGDRCPDWRPGRDAPSQARDHRARIDAWLAEGHRNVADLHRQLQAEDPALGYDGLRRYVSRRLVALGEVRTRSNASRPPTPPPPSAKCLSFAVITDPWERSEKQQARVTRLASAGEEVAGVLGLVEEFTAMLRKKSATALSVWLERASSGPSVEMQRFGEGLNRDRSAVQAALEMPWSNGPVEGAINRLKTIKRQMYGRAGLPLLRARVLFAD
jgi:DNA-binding NarL/FixJ family response regulator